MIPSPVQWVKGSAAVAWIQSLAQELPYATDTAVKLKKINKSKRKAVSSPVCPEARQDLGREAG